MKNIQHIACLALLSITSPMLAQAAVKRVPSQFPTIQSAVDAASNGDVVKVAAGTYRENVFILGKAVSLVAEDGPQRTRIDAGSLGRAVTVSYSGADVVTLSGFSLVNGLVTYDDMTVIGAGFGGAIYAESANLNVVGNVMTNNRACLGMAFHTIETRLVLRKNRIINNGDIPGCSISAVMVRGQGQDEVEITENVIADHHAIGLWLVSAGRATVSQNTFRNNDGRSEWYMSEIGGLLSESTELTLRNNLFLSNAGIGYGAVMVGAPNDPNFTAVVEGNSFVGNIGPFGAGVGLFGFSPTEFRVTKNWFADGAWQTEIYCSTPHQIQRDNVFLPPSTPTQTCFFAP